MSEYNVSSSSSTTTDGFCYEVTNNETDSVFVTVYSSTGEQVSQWVAPNKSVTFNLKGNFDKMEVDGDFF